jgi:6-phosphogluconolactonase
VSDEILVFVGTYTRAEPHVEGRAEGIYAFSLDGASGRLRQIGVTPGIANPSFLAIEPRRRTLYAVCEVSDVDGQPGGALAAFTIDGAGALTPLGRRSTGSAGPCHVCLDQTASAALVANYNGGAVTLVPLDGQARPADPVQVIQHEGSSVNPTRQQEPHPHSVVVDGGNRVALVPDLGLDRIVLYRLDVEAGKLEPNAMPWAAARPGAGPRHLSFHPGERFFYVANELDSTVSLYSYDAEEGAAEEVQAVSTLPEGFAGTNYPADIHVHPSGCTVYVSNRGHDSLAIFSIDQDTGQLEPRGYQSTRGQFPRNFAIVPGGKLLLAANQNSDSIVAFAIDEETGELEPTGEVASVPSPVCIMFLAG